MKDVAARLWAAFVLFLLWASTPLIVLAGLGAPIIIPLLLVALVVTLPVWVAAGLIMRWREK